jgi:heptosyltransferase II
MKILIIQTAFLGDLILTTAFIREVAKKFPNAEIHILIKAGTETILKNNPHIQKIISLDKKKSKSLFYFLKFISNLRKEKYSICYSAHFSFRSSQFAFFSGAKIRIGYVESGFSFLHTEKISRPIEGIHEVDKLFKLLDKEKKFSLQDKRPEIFFDELEKSEFQKLLPTEKYISIAPSSLWETKRMPVYKFIELIQKIIGTRNEKILLIGSKDDIPLTEEILKAFPNEKRIIDFAGKTNLRELAFLISKSELLISNDSSPIHFASAFNTPTLMIYGATVPTFGYSTLVDKQFISEVQNLPCRPCGIHGGKFCPEVHFQCMKNQDIKTMIKQIHFLLGA